MSSNLHEKIEQATLARQKMLDECTKIRKELAHSIALNLRALAKLPVKVQEIFEYSCNYEHRNHTFQVMIGVNSSDQHPEWRCDVLIRTLYSDPADSTELFKSDPLPITDRLNGHLEAFFYMLSDVQLEEFRLCFKYFVIKVTS